MIIQIQLIRSFWITVMIIKNYYFEKIQRKGQEGYDPDFDEESTMVEDTVTPHT